MIHYYPNRFPGVRCILRKHGDATLFLEGVAFFFGRSSYLGTSLFCYFKFYLPILLFQILPPYFVISNFTSLFCYFKFYLSILLFKILPPPNFVISNSTSIFCYFKFYLPFFVISSSTSLFCFWISNIATCLLFLISNIVENFQGRNMLCQQDDMNILKMVVNVHVLYMRQLNILLNI